MELFQCEGEEGKKGEMNDMDKYKGLENSKGEKSLDNDTKGMNECIRCRPRPALAWQPSMTYYERHSRKVEMPVVLYQKENSKSHHKHLRHYCELLPGICVGLI
jgi:hypothetical protein